jgi:uncharacterized protein (TIGR00251 family)
MTKKWKFHDSGGGTAFVVRVVPKSSRNEVAELMDDGTVRIHLTAPPVEGKANWLLIEFLSELFQVKPSQIAIVAGEKSKDKIVSIDGLSPTQVERILMASIEQKQD